MNRRSQPLVLVTEDSPETRLVLRKLCEDLIFLDLWMPRPDGMAALEQIRDHDPTVPVVIVSAKSDAATTEEALSLGAVNLIRKPFDKQEIQFVLDQIYKTLEEQADILDVLDLVGSRTTDLSFSSATAMLSKVVAYLGRELQNSYPGYEIPITEIKLALYEALANAYEHGNLEISFEEKSKALETIDGISSLMRDRLSRPELSRRRIHVKADYRRGCAVYTIRDEGPGFDHAGHRDRPLAATTALHGRGITLIGHYMDEIDWNESGNEIRITKNLQPKAFGPDED